MRTLTSARNRPIGRRSVVAGLAAGAAIPLLGTPAVAQSPGVIDAAGEGLVANSGSDQSAAFQRIVDLAAAEQRPVHLPAGEYLVAGILLPATTRLTGVPGATRLLFSGGGFFMLAESAAHVSLEGIVFDGASLPVGGAADALLRINGVADLLIDRCGFENSTASGLWLERAAGNVERCRIANATVAGLYALDSPGLRIAGNTVSDCADNGILVFRSAPGEDGTIVQANRIERIGARSGGTGQNGNGINVFRAGAVAISDNHIADCAFSAIRANGAGNVRIADNTCLRSGETAIFSEFIYEGAVVSGNLVDGAAHGINVVNFNEGGRLATVTGNIVRNLKPDAPYPPELLGFGVGISVEADTTVSGNVVENAPVCGISVGWGPYMRNVIVTGNLVRSTPKGIIVTVVEGTGPAIIADNLLSETPDGAIVAHRWQEVASGDLVDGGADAFPGLTIGNNRRG